jgi:hypothetical protein
MQGGILTLSRNLTLDNPIMRGYYPASVPIGDKADTKWHCEPPHGSTYRQRDVHQQWFVGISGSGRLQRWPRIAPISVIPKRELQNC